MRRSLFADGDLLYCKKQQGNICAEGEKDVYYSVKVTSLVDITLEMVLLVTSASQDPLESKGSH
jgi:hypothetical protein